MNILKKEWVQRLIYLLLFIPFVINFFTGWPSTYLRNLILETALLFYLIFLGIGVLVFLQIFFNNGLIWTLLISLSTVFILWILSSIIFGQIYGSINARSFQSGSIKVMIGLSMILLLIIMIRPVRIRK